MRRASTVAVLLCVQREWHADATTARKRARRSGLARLLLTLPLDVLRVEVFRARQRRAEWDVASLHVIGVFGVRPRVPRSELLPTNTTHVTRCGTTGPLVTDGAVLAVRDDDGGVMWRPAHKPHVTTGIAARIAQSHPNAVEYMDRRGVPLEQGGNDDHVVDDSEVFLVRCVHDVGRVDVTVWAHHIGDLAPPRLLARVPSNGTCDPRDAVLVPCRRGWLLWWPEARGRLEWRHEPRAVDGAHDRIVCHQVRMLTTTPCGRHLFLWVASRHRPNTVRWVMWDLLASDTDVERARAEVPVMRGLVGLPGAALWSQPWSFVVDNYQPMPEVLVAPGTRHDVQHLWTCIGRTVRAWQWRTVRDRVGPRVSATVDRDARVHMTLSPDTDTLLVVSHGCDLRAYHARTLRPWSWRWSCTRNGDAHVRVAVRDDRVWLVSPSTNQAWALESGGSRAGVFGPAPPPV